MPRTLFCSFSAGTAVKSIQVWQLEQVQQHTESNHDHQEVAFKVWVQREAALRIQRFQTLDHVRVEVSLPFDAVIREQIVDPPDPLPQQIRAPGRAKAKLLATDDLLR